ncbi:hypothetical protein SDC9_206970 [bioreactor metagenome]|uniref:Uncharacterized protein n=1 Tax=bioreactor metagenome TaxID=1076179 RepID=A0A645J963_9ZZZZ
MVRDSVEAELHGKTPENPGSFSPPEAPPKPPLGNPSEARKNGIPASPKQLQYLLDLARQRGVTPQQIAGRFRLPDLRKLTKQQCSELIDELNGRAA